MKKLRRFVISEKYRSADDNVHGIAFPSGKTASCPSVPFLIFLTSFLHLATWSMVQCAVGINLPGQLWVKKGCVKCVEY